jgi:hypothetical protein
MNGYYDLILYIYIYILNYLAFSFFIKLFDDYLIPKKINYYKIIIYFLCLELYVDNSTPQFVIFTS